MLDNCCGIFGTQRVPGSEDTSPKLSDCVSVVQESCVVSDVFVCTPMCVRCVCGGSTTSLRSCLKRKSTSLSFFAVFLIVFRDFSSTVLRYMQFAGHPMVIALSVWIRHAEQSSGRHSDCHIASEVPGSGKRGLEQGLCPMHCCQHAALQRDNWFPRIPTHPLHLSVNSCKKLNALSFMKEFMKSIFSTGSSVVPDTAI